MTERKIMRILLLIGILFPILNLMAKPAALVPVKGAPRLLEIIQATVFNPQWSDRKPAGELLNWPASAEEMKKYSAVMFLIESQTPLQWSEKEIAAAVGYLKSGGVIVFADNAENRGADPVAVRLEKSGKVYWLSRPYIANKTSYRQQEDRLNADWPQLEKNVIPLHQILMDAGTETISGKREKWDPVVLGPKADKSLKSSEKKQIELKSNRIRKELDGAPVRISAKTLILLPDAKAAGVHGWRAAAAAILQEMLKKSAGLELVFAYEPQVKVSRENGRLKVLWRGREFDSLIAIGNTEFAKTQKEKMQELSEDGVGVVIGDSAVCLFGRDPRTTVYAFLKEYLGFRWLWPGELGEVYPTFSGEIELRPSYYAEEPPLVRRSLRNGLGSKAFIETGCSKIGVKTDLYEETVKEASPWFSRQRLGGSYRHAGGDNFQGWWKKYGAEHPDWFALQFDGTRIQRSWRERLCVSNPEVTAALVRETEEVLGKRPELKYYTIAPNDGSTDLFCMCENCRKLDPPDAEMLVWRIFLGRNRPHYQYPSLSDRFLHFYAGAARELAKKKPEIKIWGLVYSCYRSAPAYRTGIPGNLKFLFVGMQYFNKKALERDRADWNAWSGLTDEMMLRPNALLEGHAMPAVYVGELDYDIKHCFRTGMVGADFDSVMHHWATQGLNYYVLSQLLWDPAANPESIVDDYCRKGFGPAAGHVRNYFRLVEELTGKVASENSGNIDETEDLTRLRYNFLNEIPRFYTQDELDKLSGILEQAYQATTPDSRERLRVEFLQAGLYYAYSTSEFLRRYHAGERKQLRDFLEKRHARLMKIRERFPFAVNYPEIAAREWGLWRECGWEPWKKADGK